MMLFGMADPWVWGGYLIAFGLVAFCVIYGWLKRNDADEDEEGED